MPNTKKLLSITNLKKYFPVAKTSIFQKNTLYVRANEDITIDIYEGETLGIVGESGCGKSTFGRVLLQLYPQTAGCTLYYGTTLDRMTPSYVEDTIVHHEKYRRKLKKSTEKYEELHKKVEEAGGEDSADFYLLQSEHLAKGEMETDVSNLVKMVASEHFEQEYQEADAGKKAGLEKKRNDAKAKLAALQKDEAAAQAQVDKITGELDALRATYSNNEQFQYYEGLRDNGVDLARLKYAEMRKLRKDLQIIFQDPYSSLNPRFTVGQIIEEGLVTHHFFRHGSARMRQYIVETMEKCGLQEYMLHRYPHQFSGGQRQRICIARALAVQPKFVVCDECVSALDVSIQSQIINLLQDLKEKQNLTYLFISHDLSVVKFISDRIAVMYLGNIVELTDKKTIFKDPRHPYTVALLSSIPTTDPGSADKERIILEGSIPSPVNPPDGCKFCTRCYMATEKCRRVTPDLVEIEPGHFCACHYPERKLDEHGEYLFEVKKSTKTIEAENDAKAAAQAKS